MTHMHRRFSAIGLVCAILLTTLGPASADSGRVVRLPNGSTVRIDQNGIGSVTSRDQRETRPVVVFSQPGKTAAGVPFGPSKYAFTKQSLTRHETPYVPGRVIVVLSNGVTVVGEATPTKGNALARRPITNDGTVNQALKALGASSLTPLLTGAVAQAASFSAIRQDNNGLNINNAFLIDTSTGADPQTAAAALRRLSSVRYAEPDWYVGGMSTEPRALPEGTLSRLEQQNRTITRAEARSVGAPLSDKLPTNFGTISSLQSYLNANGVNLYGAYAEIRNRFSQLPGAGEIITNVSSGDLTDQAMLNAGDPYVLQFGPTTIVQGNQRYLDIPSFPLIPTFTSSTIGTLDPLGTTEFQDPFNGEVLLDFSMMAPLPHDLQRPGAVGSFLTDLVGIAPGAQYRLVIPEQPSISQIDIALLAAALQQPHPNVISASLGFGFDTFGFPGRYLEEDPLAEAIVASIVQNYGIAVCISSDDGTRTFTPAAVGPDGGSVATDLASVVHPPTSPVDDIFSTISGRVFDSGSLSVGGTTTDDIFAVPPQSQRLNSNRGTFVETRFDGSTTFSSGFGDRVNVSAPSDNIPSLVHDCCTPQTVFAVLQGGTSASAPMTAAAAAVLLQVARLTGQTLTPHDLRRLLIESGHNPIQPPSADRPLHVGPQIDVTAAVEELLERHGPTPPQVIRLGVALRQNLADLGGQFVELVNTENIPLDGPPIGPGLFTGQNTVSPITIAPDIVGVTDRPGIRYELRVGNDVISRSRVTRIMPEDLLAAADLPLASASSRSLTITFDVFSGIHKLASRSKKLTFDANDGTYLEALAPIAPATVRAGEPVTVRYDIRHVRNLLTPHLVVSSINHWDPIGGPLFRVNYAAPLPALSGTVVIPASAFVAGAGVYGIGVAQRFSGPTVVPEVGEFSPIRVTAADLDDRPQAPTLSSPQALLTAGPLSSGSHVLSVTRGAPQFDVHYDVTDIPSAANAIVEISAPGPTLFGSVNMVTNHNGNQRDDNAVDSPSTHFLPQFGRSGVVHLNAETLGLQSSDFYNVRVFAGNGMRVIGQASPISTLQYDDALTPGAQPLLDFDVYAHRPSVVTTASFDGSGNPIQAFAFPYTASTQTYGAPLAADATGSSIFQAIGLDSKSLRSFVMQSQWFGFNQFIQAYDVANGQLVNQATIDNNKFVAFETRLDSQRDRLAILGLSPTDFSDQLVVLTPSTMSLTAPINVDNNVEPNAIFGLLELDDATGNAFLAVKFTNDNCVVGPGGISSYNFSTGKVAPYVRTLRCTAGMTVDDSGTNLWLTHGGRPFSRSNLIPQGEIEQVSQSSLTPGFRTILKHRSPLFPTYDKQHHVLVIGFLAAPDYLENNNSTSVIAIVDPNSGQVIKTMSGFNFARPMFSNDPGQNNERGIQLDPATRTGWTYGPGGIQVQQFKY